VLAGEAVLMDKPIHLPAGRVHGIEAINALRLLHPVAFVELIYQTMSEHEGRIPAAAEALGVSQRALYRWLRESTFAGVVRAPRGKPKGEDT